MQTTQGTTPPSLLPPSNHRWFTHTHPTHLDSSFNSRAPSSEDVSLDRLLELLFSYIYPVFMLCFFYCVDLFYNFFYTVRFITVIFRVKKILSKVVTRMSILLYYSIQSVIHLPATFVTSLKTFRAYVMVKREFDSYDKH